jgi:putative transposase
MREDGLRSKTVRRFKRTIKPCKQHEASPNLRKQDFHSAEPNRVWISDITYIATDEGWLYLTTVEDMCTRRVIGYSIQDHLRATGVLEALTQALAGRTLKPGLIFHSDRGKQYADK